jgi:hypothetical protein
MIKLTPIFKIRVVYKSGYTHDFEVYEFSVNGGRYEWKAVSDDNKPVIIGVDEIAAVYQVGVRKALKFS